MLKTTNNMYTYCFFRAGLHTFFSRGIQRFAPTQSKKVCRQDAITTDQILSRVSLIPPAQHQSPRQWCLICFWSPQHPVSSCRSSLALSQCLAADGLTMGSSMPRTISTRARFFLTTASSGLGQSDQTCWWSNQRKRFRTHPMICATQSSGAGCIWVLF